ncbi:hypothetical protein Tco_0071067 [Tanacetum coccineum]
MTNKIDTMLKAITERIVGALPSGMFKNPKLNVNSTTSVLSARSYPTEDPQCSTNIHGSINTITIHLKQQSNSHDSKAEEEEREKEGDPEDTDTIANNEEQRDTPQLELKDTTTVDNLGFNRDDEGIEWLDVEEPLDLVDIRLCCLADISMMVIAFVKFSVSMRSCKVRVGSNGNLLWEASVLYDEKKGCVMDTLKFTAMPFGLTNAPAVFMELMSRSKEEYESHVKMIVESLKEEKMYVKFSNNVEAEHRGSYLDVEGIKWVLKKDCMTNVMLYRGVGRRSEAKNEFEIGVRRSDLGQSILSILERIRWCGFRLSNQWLSMKKDVASCCSKYLAYSRVEIEYQVSSGLLLQPELLK